MSDQTLCTTETTKPEPQDVQSVNGNGTGPKFRPHVDLIDSGDAIILWADLPGADESSVDVTLEKNMLTIKASVRRPSSKASSPSCASTRWEITNGHSSSRTRLTAKASKPSLRRACSNSRCPKINRSREKSPSKRDSLSFSVCYNEHRLGFSNEIAEPCSLLGRSTVYQVQRASVRFLGDERRNRG